MSQTNRLVKLMNDFDIIALKKLLEKIITKLPCRKSQNLFTFDESEKLISLFNLSVGDLTLILQFACDAFHNAAYDIAKPENFRENLSSQGLAEKVVGVFVEVYVQYGKDLINKLKNISFSPCQLEDFNYLLNVEVASGDRSKINKPTVGLQFSLNSGEKNDSVAVEMDHQQLYAFYDKLEEIQKQLDSIMV